MCESIQETFRRQPTVGCPITWFAFPAMRDRPLLGGSDRWTGAAVISSLLAGFAIRMSARYGAIAQDNGNRGDYSILAQNLDVRSHFSSETGTSNTTVFTTPLR
jgi:hypothetical protein